MASTTTPAITSFRGAHRFLSNFHPADVWYLDVWYPTVEHAYVAAKSNNPRVRRNIATIVSPGGAKIAGRRLVLRPDWEKVKLLVMHDLLRQKFQNPHLRADLLATGDAEIIEGNTWGDQFWGAVRLPSGAWLGENHLGRLLMEVRAELQSSTSYDFKDLV